MQLKTFRIKNFRSIKDSGEIDVSRITALLGRNESGKSNLLRGLYRLNPLEGFKALNKVKDFPRDKNLEECTDDTEVVNTTWLLDEDDKEALLEILPRATSVTKITIGRRYGESRYVGFPELQEIAFDEADIKAKVKKIAAGMRAKAADGNTLEAAADAFEQKAFAMKARDTWAVDFSAAAKAARTTLAGADADLTDSQEKLLGELEELSRTIIGDKRKRKPGAGQTGPSRNFSILTTTRNWKAVKTWLHICSERTKAVNIKTKNSAKPTITSRSSARSQVFPLQRSKICGTRGTRNSVISWSIVPVPSSRMM